jgi:hypothetical protein
LQARRVKSRRNYFVNFVREYKGWPEHLQVRDALACFTGRLPIDALSTLSLAHLRCSRHGALACGCVLGQPHARSPNITHPHSLFSPLSAVCSLCGVRLAHQPRHQLEVLVVHGSSKAGRPSSPSAAHAAVRDGYTPGLLSEVARPVMCDFSGPSQCCPGIFAR